MRLSDEIKLSVLGLLALQALTSFGAIGLLARMSPAIERILSENLYSIRSSEQMLAALALLPTTPEEGAARVRAMQEGLARAKGNVTEASERPALATIEANAARALAGEPGPLRETVAAIRELAAVNHASTERADQEAQRLGAAGAWAAALLGGAGLVLGAVVVRLQLKRVVLPVLDLQGTVEAFRQGDRHRRTNRSATPAEFQEVGRLLDELIDRALAPRRATGAGAEQGLERAALLLMLDRAPHPALVIDAQGRPLAAGQAALDRLHAEEGAELRASLATLPTTPDERLPAGLRRTPLVGGAWLVELGPRPSAGAPPAEGAGED